MNWHNLVAHPQDLPAYGVEVVILDTQGEYQVAHTSRNGRWGMWFDGLLRELSNRPVGWAAFTAAPKELKALAFQLGDNIISLVGDDEEL
jgi:hypothetical protein